MNRRKQIEIELNEKLGMTASYADIVKVRLKAAEMSKIKRGIV